MIVIKFQDLSKVVTPDGLCVDESKIAAFKEELNARIKKAAKDNGNSVVSRIYIF